MPPSEVNVEQYIIDVVGEKEAQRAFLEAAEAAVKANTTIARSAVEEERAIKSVAAALRREAMQRKESISGTAAHNRALRANALASKKANGRTIEMRNSVFEFGNAMAISGGQAGLMVNQISELTARIAFSPSALGAGIALVTGGFVALNLLLKEFGSNTVEAEAAVKNLTTAMERLNQQIAAEDRGLDTLIDKIEFFGQKAHAVAVQQAERNLILFRAEQARNRVLRENAEDAILAARKDLELKQKVADFVDAQRVAGVNTPASEQIAAERGLDVAKQKLQALRNEHSNVFQITKRAEELLGIREGELQALKEIDRLENTRVKKGNKGAAKKADKLLAMLQGHTPLDIPADAEVIGPPSEGEHMRRRAIIVKDAIDEISEVTDKWRAERAERDAVWRQSQLDLEQEFWDQRVQQGVQAFQQITMASINAVEERLENNRQFAIDIESEEQQLANVRARLQRNSGDQALLAEQHNTKERIRMLRESQKAQRNLFVQIADEMLGQLGRQLLAKGIFDLADGVGKLIRNPLNPQGELLAAWGAGEIVAGSAMTAGSLIIPNASSGATPATPFEPEKEKDEDDGSGGNNLTINVQGSLSNEETMRHVRDGIQSLNELGI